MGRVIFKSPLQQHGFQAIPSTLGLHGPRPNALSCYICDSDPNYNNYDADCANPDYAGQTTSSPFAVGCATEVLDDGGVWRGIESQAQADDGPCQKVNDGGPAMRCWCPDELCNTHLCEECFTKRSQK